MKHRMWCRNDAHWDAVDPLRKNAIPEEHRVWLLSKDSLTQRLVEHSQGQFAVRVIHQGWQRPLPSEARALGTPRDRNAFVRQVQLLGAGRPWVYARTVIPLAVAHGRLRCLTHLGTRPLGAVLFSNPTMRRGPIEVARLPQGSGLHALAHQGASDSSETIWGRRSVFHLYNLPLLVSEIFLTEFPV